MRSHYPLIALCALSLWLSSAQAARLVSVNLCVDQMLLRFAARDDIASVTYFANNPAMSPYAADAQGLHRNHGLVEEIIPLAPDVVLAGAYGARQATALLSQLGYRVERVPLPEKLADIDAHLLRMAELLGEPAALQAYRQTWLEHKKARETANAQVPDSARPRALMLGPNHIAPGSGTLEHELLVLAGFRNWAADQPGFATVNLEQLVQQPPDVLIVDVAADHQFSLAHEVLQHPALNAAIGPQRVARLPSNLAVCPAPNINTLLSALVAIQTRIADLASIGGVSR